MKYIFNNIIMFNCCVSRKISVNNGRSKVYKEEHSDLRSKNYIEISLTEKL